MLLFSYYKIVSDLSSIPHLEFWLLVIIHSICTDYKRSSKALSFGAQI